MNATLLKLQNSHSILWKWRGFFWGKSSEKLLAKGSRSIIEQSRSGKSLVCFSILRMACFSALCARIFGTPCKVYIEAIELSSCWLYWVLLAEWMMLKAFLSKWEERNAKKNSFGFGFFFFLLRSSFFLGFFFAVPPSFFYILHSTLLSLLSKEAKRTWENFPHSSSTLSATQ